MAYVYIPTAILVAIWATILIIRTLEVCDDHLVKRAQQRRDQKNLDKANKPRP